MLPIRFYTALIPEMKQNISLFRILIFRLLEIYFLKTFYTIRFTSTTATNIVYIKFYNKLVHSLAVSRVPFINQITPHSNILWSEIWIDNWGYENECINKYCILIHLQFHVTWLLSFARSNPSECTFRRSFKLAYAQIPIFLDLNSAVMSR